MKEVNIPKILIQFWHDKTTLPIEYKAAIEKTAYYSSDFTIMFVDDEYMLNYLEKKDIFLFEFYKNIQIPAVRSDIASLVLLYEYGGIYLDVAMVLHKPLFSIMNQNYDVMLLRRDDQPMYKSSPEDAHAALGIIAAVPKSIFIKCCLNRLINKLIEGKYNTNIVSATTKIVEETYQSFKASKDNETIAFYDLSFKELKENHLDHLRIKGLQNSWKSLEKNGIIKLDYLNSMKNYSVYKDEDRIK